MHPLPTSPSRAGDWTGWNPHPPDGDLAECPTAGGSALFLI